MCTIEKIDKIMNERLYKISSAFWRIKTVEQSADCGQFLLTKSALLCYKFLK